MKPPEMMPKKPPAPHASKALKPPLWLALWHTLRAVLWSFFGVRRGRHHDEDMQNLKPLHVIAVALCAALLFVLGLVAVVKWVVASTATTL